MVTSTNRDTLNEGGPAGTGGPRRGVSRPLAVAATAVMLASGGIGVTAASAATPVPPPTPTPTGTADGTPATTPPPAETPTPTPSPTVTELPAVHPLQFGGAAHGEFVLGTKDPCAFVTVFAQTGEVTAVDDGSITVRSRDGFEQAYTLADDTRVVAGRRGNGEVRQGDWVALTALRQAQEATAAYVYDLSQPGRRGAWWSPRQGWPNTGRWRAPKPCPTPPQTPSPTPTDGATPTPTAPTTPSPTSPDTPAPPPGETPAPTPTSGS